MSDRLRTAPIGSLSAHLCPGKTRLETPSTLLTGQFHGRMVKQDLRMAQADGSLWSIETLQRTRRARRRIHTLDLVLPADHLSVSLAAKRNKGGEWLIVMTNGPEPKRAFQFHRRLWALECPFGDAKTRGVNLKETDLTDPEKIKTFVALLALAIAWIYRTASLTMGMKAVTRKAQGRRQKSLFRTVFGALRNAILDTPRSATIIWLECCPISIRST